MPTEFKFANQKRIAMGYSNGHQMKLDEIARMGFIHDLFSV